MIIKELLPFGAEIKNFSIKNDGEYLERLIWKYGFLLFKKLDTDINTILSFAKLLGNLDDSRPRCHPECKHIGLITGRVDKNGNPIGRLGKTSEVGWHSDNCIMKNPKPFIMFQGIEDVEHGTQEYLSNNLVLESLTYDEKNELKKAMGLFSFNQKVFQNDLKDIVKAQSSYKKLIVKSPYGDEGLFYPWLFCDQIFGTSDNEYFYNLLKSKFENIEVYKHKWDIGDLFITESIFTQHRRPPTPDATSRLLYRVNCGTNYEW
jgi:alpha-ketoglutarate-dependent taurine dioxygenase